MRRKQQELKEGQGSSVHRRTCSSHNDWTDAPAADARASMALLGGTAWGEECWRSESEVRPSDYTGRALKLHGQSGGPEKQSNTYMASQPANRLLPWCTAHTLSDTQVAAGRTRQLSRLPV